MRWVSISIFIVGIGLVGFGWWGLFTDAGQREYEGLAGLGPYLAGIAGIVLLLVAVVIFLILKFRTRRCHKAGHCRACGYNLKGSPSPTCPECGSVR